VQQTVLKEETSPIATTPTSPLVRASEAVATPAAAGQTGLLALASCGDALQRITRAEEILKQIRAAALRLTGPRDWVAMKGKGATDETATCLLTSSGARRIAPLYGVTCSPAEPRTSVGTFSPEVEQGEDGEVQVGAWCQARSALTGEEVTVSISRSNIEDFIGRQGVKRFKGTLVAKSDLVQSCHSGLHTKAVRELAGMKSVPIAELLAVGLKFDEITKGSGFGSASDREASAVTSGEVKASRKALADDIMQRVGGDKELARDLCKWATANPPKFDGFDSVERLTKDWQVENAMKKLKTHEVFGDKAQGVGAPKKGA